MDFPTLGKPISPTSAMVFSSSRTRLFAGLGKVRRVAAAVGKARVALSPVSARQNGDLLPLVIEIGDDVFGLRIPDHRAEGDV